MRLQEGGCYVHLFACQKKRTKATHSNAELLSISFEKKWTKETARGPAPATPTDGTSAAGSLSTRPKSFGNPFRTRRLTPSQTCGKGCFAPQNPLTCPRRVYTIAALAYFYSLHFRNFWGDRPRKKRLLPTPSPWGEGGEGRRPSRMRGKPSPCTWRPCGGFSAKQLVKVSTVLCLPCVR